MRNYFADAMFLFHLFFNYKSLLNYLNIKIASGRTHLRELTSAFVLTLLVITASLINWEPVASLMDLRTSIKDGEDLINMPPPVANAEDLTIPELANLVNISPEAAVNALTASNYEYSDPSLTLREIAGNNRISIEELYMTIIDNQ